MSNKSCSAGCPGHPPPPTAPSLRGWREDEEEEDEREGDNRTREERD